MLYLDSSAIVKRYFKEKGSNAVITRAAELNQAIFTSVLSFAEVQSTIARKHRERQITSQEFTRLRETFESDWTILFTAIECDLETMGRLPKLVELYALKAGDAIQLSTAIWLNEGIQSDVSPRAKEVLEFGVADRALATIADKCGLRVFNPEDEN
jgi:predicted nucleic acid-binding protein